jgi:hypothetical protein
MYFFRSNNFYLPSLRLEEGGGGVSAPCALNQDSLHTKYWSAASQHHILSIFILFFTYILGQSIGRSIVKRFWTQCTKNSKQIFPEMKLRGLVPNFYIHISVSDLYIPMIGLPILLYCIVDRSWEYTCISGSQIHAFTAHTNRSILRRQIFIACLFLCTNYLKQTLAYPIVTAVQSL